jgi:hypothetical protein
MNPLPATSASAKTRDKRGPRQPPGGADLGQGVSREARRTAALILEVLAGTRTTTEAAAALEVSMTRYYVLETRALHGLVAACEPRTQGRQRSTLSELQVVRSERDRLQREVTRQQALLRAAQRTVGLPPPPAAPPKGAGKKQRRRKPVARALTVAAHLQSDDNSPAAPAAAAATAGLQ